MATPDVTQKAGVYETLSGLNTAFAGIVQHLQTLQKTGLFKSKTAKKSIINYISRRPTLTGSGPFLLYVT
jgi:hypothetical protein